MLSSNGHVTLQLTVFEIFVVKLKWPKFRPKFRIWGSLGLGAPPLKGEGVSGTDMYHHAKFHDDR